MRFIRLRSAGQGNVCSAGMPMRRVPTNSPKMPVTGVRNGNSISSSIILPALIKAVIIILRMEDLVLRPPVPIYPRLPRSRP